MSEAATSTPDRPPLWLSYLRLLRAPNVFTAMADVLLGWLLVTEGFREIYVLGSLLAASSCLYLAGMVLNDVFDIEVDRAERPSRPLPSGAISLATARILGMQLLVTGAAMGFVASGLAPHAAMRWRAGLVGVLLAACVLLYDGWAKKTVLGPLVMGWCRTFNVLLGMSLAEYLPSAERFSIFGYGAPQLLVAGGLGLYIAGVTWFARGEAGRSRRLDLVLGLLAIPAGIAVAGLFAIMPLEGAGLASDDLYLEAAAFGILLLLISLNVGLRCAAAAFDPAPQNVQIAVKTALLALVVLDASLCAALRGPILAGAIILLLVPAVLLGRLVYST